MCGIIGFTGDRQAIPVLLEGLEALEYRGYDSAGIAICREDDKFQVAKTKGRLENLQQEISDKSLKDNGCGIGHTRWATHGEPSALFGSLMFSWAMGMVLTIIVYAAGKWKKKMYASHSELE